SSDRGQPPWSWMSASVIVTRVTRGSDADDVGLNRMNQSYAAVSAPSRSRALRRPQTVRPTATMTSQVTADGLRMRPENDSHAPTGEAYSQLLIRRNGAQKPGCS